MTTISLMLAVALTLPIPHIIDSYWLTILMLKIPKKLRSIFLRSTTLQTLQKVASCIEIQVALIFLSQTGLNIFKMQYTGL